MVCRRKCKMLKKLLIFLLYFFILGTHFISEGQSLKQAAKNILTRQEAQARKKQIKSVNYELEFRFRKNAGSFDGTTKIAVELNTPGIPLRIDAAVTEIKKIVVNDHQIRDAAVYEGFLEIPSQYLRSENEIVIDYQKKYSKKSNGFYYFKDPVDEKEYIYTSSEPYGAHAFFPCFDQPDLKAKFDVTQIIPGEWVAVSNNPVESTRETKGGKVVKFKQTPLLSTYLLFIGCGDYVVWHSMAGSIPVALYARQDMAQYVEAETAGAFFDITRKGLKFFGEYFDFSYPFEKYDYIFSPELFVGGMENPGAVTVNENMIFRGVPTEMDLLGRSNLILHEMAHMWFGDLVTMEWWEDLWLNESFATLMAFIGQEDALGLGSEAWQIFVGMKEWAYRTDQLITTHPIVSDIFDTDMAVMNFDGITYGKGAAVLRQLQFYVGPESFQKGVRSYFKKYQWGNASLGDFIREIAMASGEELEDWSGGWLQSAGLNSTKPVLQYDNDRISEFLILQEPTVSGKFLPHKTRIGFFEYTESGTLELYHVIDSRLSGSETRIEKAAGLKRPDFVYANLEGYDYIFSSLDPQSLDAIKKDLNKINDPTLRKMLWLDLGRMVRARELGMGDFINAYLLAIQKETDQKVLAYLLSEKSYFSGFFWNILTPSERDVVAPELERVSWSSLQKLPANSPSHVLWLDYFLSIAHTGKAQDNLLSLLNTSWLDQKRRWKVIQTLSRLGASDTPKLIEAELQRDATFLGQTAALSARVAFPDKTNKEEAWKVLTGPDKEISSYQRTVVSKFFHNPDYPELSEAYVDRFFDFVCNEADWSRIWYMRDVFGSLFPHNLCSQKVLAKSQNYLNGMKTLSPAARRIWLEANDVLERNVKIRHFNQNWLIKE
ncbi:MAG: aminopeptidase N [wastewater metagenome]|nr:aminopeptidase N [Candidatus Loosdrechtia aerotolerans]